MFRFAFSYIYTLYTICTLDDLCNNYNQFVGCLVKDIWTKFFELYQKTRSQLDNLPSGSGYPDDIDTTILKKLSILGKYIGNRPVLSSLTKNRSTHTESCTKSGKKILHQTQINLPLFKIKIYNFSQPKQRKTKN